MFWDAGFKFCLFVYFAMMCNDDGWWCDDDNFLSFISVI